MEDNRTKIKGGILGQARYIEFFDNGKLVKNIRQPGEVFFTVKKRIYDGDNFKFSNSKYGYIHVTEGMREIFGTLFQERKENMHIEFIEWSDSFNVVFCDGIYISQRMCRLEKEEFYEWEKNMLPAEV